jgi:glycosyltransferase involved in cell wall biosynthesis
MRIVAYVHLYQPRHNAGAEAMLHEILLELVNEYGHEAKVICMNPLGNEYQGIELIEVNDERVPDVLKWADVIFTHLDFTKRAARWSQRVKKPLVHLIHNDRQATFHGLTEYNSQLLVSNSQWIHDSLPKKIKHLSTIVYPPTEPDRYRVEPTGDAITLLNMNEAKGGKVFWELARLMPDRKFIGVRGAYGEQIDYPKTLPNVTIYKNDPDVKKIYEQSRIIIMPSEYESWGRVAIEAASSGIPVIANPTPGLKESLGNAGVFADWTSIADFADAIKMLDDKKIYNKHSKMLKERSVELYKEFKKQVAVLDERLDSLPRVRRRPS